MVAATPRQGRAMGVVLVVVLLAAAAGGFAIWNFRQKSEQSVGKSGGFRDAIDETGITFRMKFIDKEQGENFKTNLYDHGCGVAIGDYDGDGHDDIYFVNQLGKNALYHNKGDGTFEDVTDRAGVGLGDRICVAATWADYDNDGKLDLFVTSTRGGNVLFKNLGNGKFRDVTKEAGVAYVGHSQTAVFFDYDNDGYLDLLVTNTAKWTLEPMDPELKYYPGGKELWALAGSPKEHNILYHNNGDGTFTDVTKKAGLGGKGWCGDVAVFDYDEDGYLDVLVTNMFGRSQLYHNNRNGTFTDVTEKTLRKTSWGAAGAKVFDFNNDGKLDLFITDMHSDMWVTLDTGYTPVVVESQKYLHADGPTFEVSRKGREDEKKLQDSFNIQYDQVLFGNTLFKNLGGGQFEELSDQAGMETFWPWGIATGDFDNDGYEDVFIPSGMGYPFFYWPNYLMMNNSGGTWTKGEKVNNTEATFINRAKAEGIEPPARGIYQSERIGGKPASRSSRAAAVADFDGDGRLEIVVNNFNDRPYYFKNQFPKKNYIAFRLEGTRSNRDAIGALVRLKIGDEIMVRQVNPAGGYLAQSSKTVHFGLGDRQKVDSVEIRWPRSEPQTIENPAINQVHKIVERSQ